MVPKRILVKVSAFDNSVELVVIGGRISKFPIGYDDKHEVPIVPFGPLGRLIMLYYHDKYHHEVDTVVAVARADVWVEKARKLAVMKRVALVYNPLVALTFAAVYWVADLRHAGII